MVVALYNEIEPYAAEWLRNLVAAGHIADGKVDTRSIVDLVPSDIKGTQAHFFAGLGGWSHALRLAGWPDDVPVWTGSCPCQPFSAAGKRKGFDDERHLWPVWFRLIRECAPAIVFGEQVASPDGLEWFDAVSADLEGAGYAVAAADLCAAGVGAPHLRQRLYFVAIATDERCHRLNALLREGRGRGANDLPETARRGAPGDLQLVGNSGSPRLEGRTSEPGDDGAEQPPAERAGYWSGAEWIQCTDGKARPVEPGSFPLVDGPSAGLDAMRAIEDRAALEVMRHVDESKNDAGEVLRVVRDGVRSWPGRQATGAGVRVELPASEVLLDFLLCVEAACDRAADEGRRAQARQEAQHRIVRSLQFGDGDRRTPRGRESIQQSTGESADTLLKLPLVLARHAAAYQQAAVSAHAAVGRTGLIRAYGNAIVPQVAATFIRSVMESL